MWLTAFWWFLTYEWCVEAKRHDVPVHWWHEMPIGDTIYVTPIANCMCIPTRKIRFININDEVW